MMSGKGEHGCAYTRCCFVFYRNYFDFAEHKKTKRTQRSKKEKFSPM